MEVSFRIKLDVLVRRSLRKTQNVLASSLVLKDSSSVLDRLLFGHKAVVGSIAGIASS